jgi:hypothetical protein
MMINVSCRGNQARLHIHLLIHLINIIYYFLFLVGTVARNTLRELKVLATHFLYFVFLRLGRVYLIINIYFNIFISKVL